MNKIIDNNPVALAASNAEYAASNPSVFGGPIPPSPSIPPVPTAPTVGALGLTYNPDPNQVAIDAAAKASATASGYYDANGNVAAAPDQNTVYNNTLKNFQSQIDGLNTAAAQARAQVNATYKPIEDNRVGQATAIQGRRGLLGSDFGAAQTDTVNTANANELSTAIAQSDAKYQDQINALYGQARTISSNDYNAKLQAYSQGADATIAHLKDKQIVAANNATTLARQALASGINLSDPANINDVNKLAAQIGIAPQALLSAFGDAQQSANKAKLENDKAAADLANVYATIAKDQGETLTPEQALAKANADIGKTVQETKTSAASAAASLASAASSYASAAKSRAETGVLNANNSTYVKGTNPTVDAFVQGFNSGKYKASDIPNNIAGLVAQGIASTGNPSTAQSDLLQTTKSSLATLQNYVDTDHGFQASVGAKNIFTNPGQALGITKNPIAGSAAADFEAKLKQTMNDVVLPNLTLLHGLGRVTDREFQALQSSISSLSPSLSETEFKKELKDITDKVNAASSATSDNSSTGSSFNGITLPH